MYMPFKRRQNQYRDNFRGAHPTPQPRSFAIEPVAKSEPIRRGASALTLRSVTQANTDRETRP